MKFNIQCRHYLLMSFVQLDSRVHKIEAPKFHFYNPSLEKPKNFPFPPRKPIRFRDGNGKLLFHLIRLLRLDPCCREHLSLLQRFLAIFSEYMALKIERKISTHCCYNIPETSETEGTNN